MENTTTLLSAMALSTKDLTSAVMLGVEIDDPILAVWVVAKYLVEMGVLVIWVESVVRRRRAVKDIDKREVDEKMGSGNLYQSRPTRCLRNPKFVHINNSVIVDNISGVCRFFKRMTNRLQQFTSTVHCMCAQCEYSTGERNSVACSSAVDNHSNAGKKNRR